MQYRTLPPPEVATSRAGVPFARELAEHGDRVAIVTDDGEWTYTALAARVGALVDRLGTTRRLVMVTGANTVDALVGYLAGLAGGHPVLLAPADHPDAVVAMTARYDPDVVIGGGVVREVRSGSAHQLHDELALLLSTSGSTGSAKLVRLSAENLRANAESIAAYLGIRPDDRAATTLPMHYCYGLSVINSHLSRGASLLLTDRSVTDPAFWTEVRAAGVTNLAGVPYTFDLLDRVGFDRMDLPSLRLVTQAGGRLAADRVRGYAELGRRHGWDFFVMYGQTEATARMAYLPPDLAIRHPQCVGVAIPGGALRLRPVPDSPDPAVGELVYTGPNVMLGYAESTADLRLGRSVYELHTGDLARRNPDGLFEIVGRRTRFAKIFGLRIDLQHVETALAGHGVTACCLNQDDDHLAVVVETAGRARNGPTGTVAVRRLVRQATRLPARTVDVYHVPRLPRLANGKPDIPAARALARASVDPAGGQPGSLVALYAEILHSDEVTEESTFTGLGGDSLSYVAMSIRLEQALGRLPEHWHTTPIRDLRPAGVDHAPPRRAGRWRRATLDTGVALRAAAIVLIVGTHATLFGLEGGAHLLLAVAGFNFARFHLTAAPRAERLLGMWRSTGRIVVASVTWIVLAALFLADNYDIAKILLVNYITFPGRFNDFWFIETLVYLLLASSALLAVPAVDRIERRLPFTLPVALTAVGLVTRYELIPGVTLTTPLLACWLFTLGWATAKAHNAGHRLLVTVAGVATIPGFHGDPGREAIMIAGLIVLIWIPALPSLALLNRAAGVLASASLYIYLTHWQVYSRLDHYSPLLAVIASLAVGIGYAALVRRIGPTAGTLAGRLTGGLTRRGRTSRRRSGRQASAPAVRRAWR